MPRYKGYPYKSPIYSLIVFFTFLLKNSIANTISPFLVITIYIFYNSILKVILTVSIIYPLISQEDEKFLTDLFAQLTDEATDEEKRQELVRNLIL